MASAAMAAEGGSALSHVVGLAKELRDADGGSGFSFADLSANRAGIRFAQALESGQLKPIDLANDFGCYAFLPRMEGLPEGLPAKTFQEQFGGTDDPRFHAMLREIDSRLEFLNKRLDELEVVTPTDRTQATSCARGW